MFSFRKDKTGFFAGLALSIIALGTLISTLVLLFTGIYQGNWDYYSIPMRIVLGISWIVCITIVWTRVIIYDKQRIRDRKTDSSAAETPQQPGASTPQGGHS